MKKDVFEEQFGEIRPELLIQNTEKSIKDLKEYIKGLMDERREGKKLEDSVFANAILTAFVKIASLELARRSLSLKKGKGFEILRALMTDAALELTLKSIMKDIADSEIGKHFNLADIIDEHDCTNCPDKDSCPPEKIERVMKAKEELKKDLS